MKKKKTILGCTTCKACQRKQVDDTSKGIDHMYSLLQILKTATSTLKEKKLFKHFQTKAHLAAADIIDKSKGDLIVQEIVNRQFEKISTTAQVFTQACIWL